MNATSARPVRKVAVGTATGALVTVVVWALNVYVLPPNPPIPGEIAAMITTVLTFAVSYLTPAAASEQAAPPPPPPPATATGGIP